MGPQTKGKDAKKARREAVGPSASAESTQPKVRQQQEVQPGQSQSPGVPCHVNWCVFTMFSKVEDNVSGIPVISSLYALGGEDMSVSATHESGAFNTPAPCHWGTDTHTAVRTRGRWHGERTLKVPRRHGVSTLNVPSLWDFLRAILCVGARRPQETYVAGTVAAESLSDPNQPQETQNLRRNSAAAPDTQEP